VASLDARFDVEALDVEQAVVYQSRGGNCVGKATASVMPTAIRRRLLAWYRRNGRHDLPWRQTRDPWRVLLAELMLQRTRADLVRPVYDAVLLRYPTAAALADAETQDVQRIGRPLGLRHRLPRMQAAAAAVQDGVPSSHEGLLRLPGIGPYAANATLCFAFGKRVPIVDGSVIRLLNRLTGLTSERARPRDDPFVWGQAEKLLPKSNVRAWNWALLDLTALVCRTRPRCSECPLLPCCPTGQRVAIRMPDGTPINADNCVQTA
jgi:A/G-specific adenine glycosylase